MKDKYLKYSVEELVQDHEFSRWIQSTSAQQEEEKVSWLQKHPEMADKVKEVARIVEGITFDDIDTSHISTSDLWDRIELEAASLNDNQKPKTRLMYIAIGVAASLLVLILANPFGQSLTTVYSEHGTIITHILPDQSSIKLNDGSNIKYHSKTFATSRKISLQGEAFFEVRKGAPFTVETPLGNVQVLGTSFNVFCHDQRFIVECQTGKVRVVTGSNELVLTAGQQSNLAPDGTLTSIPATRKNLTWLEGVFQYENAPLPQVVSELERQFDVQIKLDKSVQKMTYTGFFEDKSLEKALQSVFWPLKLKPENHGKTILIRPMIR